MTDAAKDSKAEDAKAEDPKTDAPDAEAAKADDAKADDAKADDAKADDAKADDAKADDAKADDAKADDAKAKGAKGKGAKAKGAKAKDAKADDAKAEPAAPAPAVPSKVDIQTLAVDDAVTCWCGKCKTFRPHTVKTLQPPKPPKSVCLTCRAVHQVRLVEPGTKKARTEDRALVQVAPWPELVAGVNPDDATRYAITGNYQPDDFVMHKLFGLGKVVQIGTMQRARIAFEVGIKWMLQNHQA
jgi:hypothetical protein